MKYYSISMRTLVVTSQIARAHLNAAKVQKMSVSFGLIFVSRGSPSALDLQYEKFSELGHSGKDSKELHP